MTQSGQIVAPSGVAMGDDRSLMVLSEVVDLLADAVYVVTPASR